MQIFHHRPDSHTNLKIYVPNRDRESSKLAKAPTISTRCTPERQIKHAERTPHGNPLGVILHLSYRSHPPAKALPALSTAVMSPEVRYYCSEIRE